MASHLFVLLLPSHHVSKLSIIFLVDVHGRYLTFNWTPINSWLPQELDDLSGSKLSWPVIASFPPWMIRTELMHHGSIVPLNTFGCPRRRQQNRRQIDEIQVKWWTETKLFDPKTFKLTIKGCTRASHMWLAKIRCWPFPTSSAKLQ